MIPIGILILFFLSLLLLLLLLLLPVIVDDTDVVDEGEDEGVEGEGGDEVSL